jgi:hypothetical protein
MAGRRRTQRSVRVTVAASLLAVASCGVVASLALSAAVGAAAIFVAVAGVAAARIVYTDVLQTRRDTSRSRADQALAFAQSLSGLRAEHSQAVAELTVRLRARERSISDLQARARAAEDLSRAAQSRADLAAARADESRARLFQVLDAVLASPAVPVDPEEPGHPLRPVEAVKPAEPEAAGEESYRRELPTVVDLLAWEERANASREDRNRRHA